jgi:Ca2+-dependent lipid-binding protein
MPKNLFLQFQKINFTNFIKIIFYQAQKIEQTSNRKSKTQAAKTCACTYVHMHRAITLPEVQNGTHVRDVKLEEEKNKHKAATRVSLPGEKQARLRLTITLVPPRQASGRNTNLNRTAPVDFTCN